MQRPRAHGEGGAGFAGRRGAEGDRRPPGIRAGDPQGRRPADRRPGALHAVARGAADLCAMASRRSVCRPRSIEVSCMDGDANLDKLAFSKFAIGQPVPRNEDPVLVCGQGRYTDDLNLPGQAYAVMVRSGYAHGIINGIDTEEARGMPGVLGVFTGPDLSAAGIKNMPLGMPIPTRDGSPPHRPSCPVLTSDKVRYVGDPIAIVVAETAVQAKDAAEAVLVDIDAQPAVTSCSAAAM